MSVTFRRAIRENAPVIICVSGGTGSGKTYSAMRLAKGMTPPGKSFAVIDTENGRATHYAEDFDFDIAQLSAPFTPMAYGDAITAADKAGYPVIVVDSGSHEWAGDGGILDWQEDELDRMAGKDYQRREACKFSAWIQPKKAHKEMMQRILQIKAHLILCFRAEEKIELVKKDGKLVVQPKESLSGKDGWIPICEKNLPFEATCSFLLLASNPGIPHAIKLEGRHKPFFPTNAPLDEEAGKKMAAWAAGGAMSRPTTQTTTNTPPATQQQRPADPPAQPPQSAPGPREQAAIEKRDEFQGMLERCATGEELEDVYTSKVVKGWHVCFPNHRQELSALYGRLKKQLG